MTPPHAPAYTPAMSNDYTIRPARLEPKEARAIARVERQTLGDSPYSAERILEILKRDEHHALVALADDEVMGFCSTFETASGDGKALEIDMLGVLPAYQRRGIGTDLIRRGVALGLELGIRHCRGVVASDNTASRRAFQRAGLRASSHLRALLVYEIRGTHPYDFLPPGWQRLVHTLEFSGRGPLRPNGASPPPGRERHLIGDARGAIIGEAECLRVQTLAYRGIWLEELRAESRVARRVAARSVVERAKTLGLDEVGYLKPVRSSPSNSLWREGFQERGNYLIFRSET